MSSVWEAVQKSLPGWWCGTIRRCRRRSPCDEHREVAVPGAGVRCAEEPLGPYRRLPRVGYVAVANHDLLRSKLGEVGAIAQLLPAHRRARVNVLAVEDHVLVSTLARHGISAIENPKLRWPEAGELRAPEPMPPQAQPTVDGLWPAGVGDQRQQGMGFPRTDRRNHAHRTTGPAHLVAPTVRRAPRARTRSGFYRRCRGGAPLSSCGCLAVAGLCLT